MSIQSWLATQLSKRRNEAGYNIAMDLIRQTNRQLDTSYQHEIQDRSLLSFRFAANTTPGYIDYGNFGAGYTSFPVDSPTSAINVPVNSLTLANTINRFAPPRPPGIIRNPKTGRFIRWDDYRQLPFHNVDINTSNAGLSRRIRFNLPNAGNRSYSDNFIDNPITQPYPYYENSSNNTSINPNNIGLSANPTRDFQDRYIPSFAEHDFSHYYRKHKETGMPTPPNGWSLGRITDPAARYNTSLINNNTKDILQSIDKHTEQVSINTKKTTTDRYNIPNIPSSSNYIVPSIPMPPRGWGWGQNIPAYQQPDPWVTNPNPNINIPSIPPPPGNPWTRGTQYTRGGSVPPFTPITGTGGGGGRGGGGAGGGGVGGLLGLELDLLLAKQVISAARYAYNLPEHIASIESGIAKGASPYTDFMESAYGAARASSIIGGSSVHGDILIDRLFPGRNKLTNIGRGISDATGAIVNPKIGASIATAMSVPSLMASNAYSIFSRLGGWNNDERSWWDKITSKDWWLGKNNAAVGNKNTTVGNENVITEGEAYKATPEERKWNISAQEVLGNYLRYGAVAGNEKEQGDIGFAIRKLQYGSGLSGLDFQSSLRTGFKYGLAGNTASSVLNYGSQLNVILEEAVAKGMDRASVLQSIDAAVTSQAQKGGAPNPEAWSNYIERFSNLPGGRTGELATTIAGGMGTASTGLNTDPIQATVWSHAAQQAVNPESFIKMIGGQQSFAKLMQNPAMRKAYTDYAGAMFGKHQDIVAGRSILQAMIVGGDPSHPNNPTALATVLNDPYFVKNFSPYQRALMMTSYTGLNLAQQYSSLTSGQPNTALPRGIRDYNPGNLMYVPGQPGVLRSDTPGVAGGIGIYPDMPTGIAANLRQYLMYQDRGLKSIKDMVLAATPRKQNPNVDAYIAGVAKSMGVSEDVPIDLRNPATAAKYIAAISNQENSMIPAMTDITAGVYKALKLSPTDRLNNEIEQSIKGGNLPPANFMSSNADVKQAELIGSLAEFGKLVKVIPAFNDALSGFVSAVDKFVRAVNGSNMSRTPQ